MAINKVVFGTETLIDLTGDTVTPEVLLAGYTAHNASGEPVEGDALIPDDVEAALTEKGVTVPDGARISDLAALISGIEVGGGGTATNVTPKDVNFIDYYGTVLYSYTLDEAQALTELPPLPTHSGLICQGWNWSLDDIKALGRDVTVGAMYITDDGKTRLYIHLEDGRTSPMLGICPNGTVTVDWGDGTATDTLTGTSTSTVRWTPNHEYASAGDYIITLTVDGSASFYGSTSSNDYAYILRYSSSADARNRCYQNALRKVEIGSNITSIGSYAFYNCSSLSSITIPSSVTSIGSYAFGNCSSLSSITIPSSVTSIYTFTFHNCYSLSSITIPSGATSIDRRAFRYCSSLSSITIPSSVTSIGNDAFDNCSGVKYYDFTNHAAVPALSNATVFYQIAADCEIRVPASLYDEWIAATNWSTYANYIVAV